MKAQEKIERVCKWRAVFAGWQLGTRGSDDPEARAVRDQRELLILLRIEVSALVRLCLDAGVFSLAAFEAQIGDEADALNAAYQQRFPGIEATEYGVAIVDVQKAVETMRGWKP